VGSQRACDHYEGGGGRGKWFSHPESNVGKAVLGSTFKAMWRPIARISEVDIIKSGRGMSLGRNKTRIEGTR